MNKHQPLDEAMAMAAVQAKNTSGINPTEYKVLVEPMQIEERTAGGIILPDMTKDTEKFAQTKGRIIAVSPLAFSYVTDDEWAAAGADKPKPGDLVIYGKYAGFNLKGQDGKDYTMIIDKDICATIEE